jgi:hypothetical protein
MTLYELLIIAGFIVACVVVSVLYVALMRWLDRVLTRRARYEDDPVDEWQPPDDDPEDDGAQAIRRVA